MTRDVAALIAQTRTAESEPSKTPTTTVQREQLQRIAAEFESMLVNQVLKDMRRSGKWDGEEESNDSLGAQSLFEMIDTELSRSLSSSRGGLGLGKQLLEQFDRMNIGVKPAAGADVAAAAVETTANAVERRVSTASPNILDAMPESIRAGLEDMPESVREAVVRAVERAGTMAVPSQGVPAADPVADQAAEASNPVAAKVTSRFGWRRDPLTGVAKFHKGVDLKAAYGQDVQAAGGGRVVFSGQQGGYGTTVMVEHADGTRTRYAHLSVALVSAGDTVAPGQALGRAGSTGRSTGPHLHFEVLDRNGKALDPMTHRVS